MDKNCENQHLKTKCFVIKTGKEIIINIIIIISVKGEK